MELRQIKYFIEVAKREHVTEAAEALHVAQSAVSRQIFKLEEEIGVNLFIREGRNVKLTPIGRIFLDHMKRATKVIEQANQVIKEYTDPDRGTINIGFPTSLSSYILPKAISHFRKKYPDVNFELHQGSYNSLVQSVIKGDINIAILGPLPPTHKKLKSMTLFTEEIVALLPTTHRLARRSSISLQELREEAFVMFPEGYVLRDIVIQGCRQGGFEPDISFLGEDMDAIKGLVSAGLGIALIPEVTLVDCLPRETVKVSIKEPKIKRSVGVIIPVDRQLLPTEKMFYQFINSFFTRLQEFRH